MKTKIFFLMIVTASFLMAAKNTHHPLMKAEHKNFNKPDEVREFPLGKLELIKIGGVMVGKATFQPGWRWSSSVKPSVKTKSCEAPHFQYHVSGTLRILMDDGTTFDCTAGDVSTLPMGHDAWVIGNEPVVVVDFEGMRDYASHQKKHSLSAAG